MHLSHLNEDLENWYLNFDFQQRVDTAFRPNLDVQEGTQTVPPGARTTPRVAASRRPGLHTATADRPQRVDPDRVAARPRLRRRGRDGLPQGHGDPAPRRLQHARQPVLLDADGARRARSAGRRASTSSSSTRRATTSTATGWRWTACCRTARGSPFRRGDRGPGLQRGAAHDAPPELPRPAAAPPLVPAGELRA